MSYRTFDEYWNLKGSREQVESHEERARRAWTACQQALQENPNAGLCGLSMQNNSDIHKSIRAPDPKFTTKRIAWVNHNR